MYVFGSGWCRRCGGEWTRGLGLGFTNPVGTEGVLDVCLCLGCSGASGEWVAGLESGSGRVVYVCMSCESGFFV